MYDIVQSVKIKCWKHAWLHAKGWDAFGVWLEARWNPLEPEERLAFVLEITGGKTDHSLLFDEIGELVDDCMLSIDAYSSDPEVPTEMIMPYVHINGESNFGSTLKP